MNGLSLFKSGLKLDKNQWDRLFDNVLDMRSGFDLQGFGTGWIPSVDVEEAKDEYRFYAEMPGMKQEDIKISLAENVLTISGEKKAHYDVEKGNFHRLERDYGSFQRSFSLPQRIQADKIKASFKDGILEITVPKSEEAKPRHITVTAG
jgi:HSP20 family protein